MFTEANWSRASTSANEPLNILQGGGTIGCFRTYNYYSPLDTQATIAGAGYFNDVNFDIETGDVIYAESPADGTIVSYLATNTAGVITVAAFNFGAGAVGTANILDGAVTYAKIQQVAAQSLLGNPTGAPANVSEIGVGNGLTFTAGTLGISTHDLVYATGTITAAQWNNMYGVPQLIIPTPPLATDMIVIEQFVLNINFGGTQFAAGGAVILQYGNTIHGGGVNAASGTIAAATINGLNANAILNLNNFSDPTLTATTIQAPVYLSNQGAAFTTGNSTWTWDCWYRIVAAT